MEIIISDKELTALRKCVVVAGKSYDKGLREFARIPGITMDDLTEYESILKKEKEENYEVARSFLNGLDLEEFCIK